MENDKEFCEVWKKKREEGKSKYIITYGVLLHVAIAIPIISMLQMFMEKNFSLSVILTPEGIKGTLMFTTLLALAGAINTLSKWNKNERRYNALKSQIRPKPKKKKSI